MIAFYPEMLMLPAVCPVKKRMTTIMNVSGGAGGGAVMTMNTKELRAARDEAFAAYLAVKKAGGRSPAKLKALIVATREWHRAAKFDTVIDKAMQKGRKSA